VKVGVSHHKVFRYSVTFAEIVLHQPTGVLYLACSIPASRTHWTPAVERLNSAGRSNNDYVATYDPSTSVVTRLNIVGFPGTRGLSLHGMDVVPSASSPHELFVYLVNHRTPTQGDSRHIGADSSVEIFKTNVGSDVLTYLHTVEDSKVIITPNDVIGASDGRSFYFTNDHGERTGLVSEQSINADLTWVTFVGRNAHSFCWVGDVPLLDIVTLRTGAKLLSPARTLVMASPKLRMGQFMWRIRWVGP
jgi:hypothetical protein